MAIIQQWNKDKVFFESFVKVGFAWLHKYQIGTDTESFNIFRLFLQKLKNIFNQGVCQPFRVSEGDKVFRHQSVFLIDCYHIVKLRDSFVKAKIFDQAIFKLFRHIDFTLGFNLGVEQRYSTSSSSFSKYLIASSMFGYSMTSSGSFIFLNYKLDVYQAPIL